MTKIITVEKDGDDSVVGLKVAGTKHYLGTVFSSKRKPHNGVGYGFIPDDTPHAMFEAPCYRPRLYSTAELREIVEVMEELDNDLGAGTELKCECGRPFVITRTCTICDNDE